LEGVFRKGKHWNTRGVRRRFDGTVEEGEWVRGKLVAHGTPAPRDSRTLEERSRRGAVLNPQEQVTHAHGAVGVGHSVENKLSETMTMTASPVIQASDGEPVKETACDALPVV
jgi:hypothetical protein